MLSGVKRLWHSHRLLLLAFGLAATLTLFFAVRMVVFGIYWADPKHQNQPLEGWMTLRYVAHSYDLQREDALAILGVSSPPGGRQSLQKLAREQGMTLQELQSRIDAFVASRPAQ